MKSLDGKFFYFANTGDCVQESIKGKRTFSQLVGLMIDEGKQIIAISRDSLVSDEEAEKEFESGGGMIKSFRKYNILSMPGIDNKEVAKIERCIEEKTVRGEKMVQIEEILKKLMEVPPKYIAQFGRDDPTLEIIQYLLFRKTEKLNIIARKFAVKSTAALSLYYRFGVPFKEHGFEEKEDWPILYDQETDSLVIQHPDATREFLKLSTVPDDFQIEVIHPSTKKKKIYTAQDLVKISLEKTQELANIVHGYFSQVPHDQIKRPYVEIIPLRGGKFVLSGPFWLFSLIVRAGSHAKGKEGLTDERAVIKAFTQLITKGTQEKFIDDDKVFPLVISSGFTESAIELAGQLPTPAVLLPVEEFIRLIDFIEKLGTSKEKEVAFWALFRLGKIREADPSRRIDAFIDEVIRAVSKLEEEVSQ